MPSRSIAQNRWAHWVVAHPAQARAEGVKLSVGADYLQADHGRSLKGLPERVKKAEGGAVYPRPFKW